MSAFIIGKDEMDDVVCFLKTHGVGGDTSQIGRNLYAMNEAAVLARYPGDTRATMPGPIDKSHLFEAYTYHEPERPSFDAGIKAAKCLLYQCSEGDVPSWRLFKALEAVVAKRAAAN